MNAVQRREKMLAELHPNARRLPHVARWKAMSRLRDCLSPLIQAAFRAGMQAGATARTIESDDFDAEIARLRREIVDYSYIAQYSSEPG